MKILSAFKFFTTSYLNVNSKKTFYKLSKTCQIDKLEDIYELFLGCKNDGYFVEFGAYDGEYVSNTSGLADLGWNGLYIEPVTVFYDKVKERHKDNDVSIVKCAFSNKKGS